MLNKSEQEFAEMLAELQITVTGNDIPHTISSFEECTLTEEPIEEMKRQGFSKDSAIQAQGGPIALSARDLVVGIAQSVKGKSLAYMLPAMVHVANQPPLQRGDGPIALVLAPTRELAQQIKCNLPEYAIEEMKRQGFIKPSTIQAQGWPIALSGRDSVVGIAQSVKGKSLAYMLPAMVHVANQPPLQRGDGPIALVLAPTRELAQQIQSVVCDYGHLCKPEIRRTCILGGSLKVSQARDFRSFS